MADQSKSRFKADHLKHQKMEVWNGISLTFWESLIATVQDFLYLYTKYDKRYKDTLLVENTWDTLVPP